MNTLFLIFVIFKILRTALEVGLAFLNQSFCADPRQMQKACSFLHLEADEYAKALAYAQSRFRFELFSQAFNLGLLVTFLGFGGLGLVEFWAQQANLFPDSQIFRGLSFFFILGGLSFLMSIPFDLYNTFVIEERHGFNKQTLRSYVIDQGKQLGLTLILGGALLTGLLKVMETAGDWWWLGGWGLLSGFSILMAWLYPTVLAPLFNTFKPIMDGSLKTAIEALAQRTQFQMDGIFVMDASRRSAHGNAYFTGMFGKKRIVLFDTLLNSLKEQEIIAVLAHELGHFQLNHVRWMLVRSILLTGLFFYFFSLCLPLETFYHAFSLQGVSTYGALVVFSLWFGVLDFFMTPLSSYLSRRNEFAADRFAHEQLSSSLDLCTALLKLREANRTVPISHPLYSMVYHSHPPILERLEALHYTPSH